MSKYNPWPLGKPIIERPEPEQIRKMGYKWDDARQIIALFEAKVAAFAGSEYAVAVDSCTHAIALSIEYEILFGENVLSAVTIPVNTYISVLQAIDNQYISVKTEKTEWRGAYQIKPTRVWDAAVRWTEDMYIEGSLMCLSFQQKKRIPIGRGGMILCNSRIEYDWLKLASYDGRDLNTPYDSKGHVKMNGRHYYMTPEDAARGIILMDNTPRVNEDSGGWENYPDICILQQHR